MAKKSRRRKPTGTNLSPANQDPFIAARKHLKRAAVLLESFARGVPLVFTKRVGEELRWVSGLGPHTTLYPRPEEVLNRFYQAIEAVRDALKSAGCRGPDGQPIRDGYVLEWMEWSYIKSPAHPSMAQLLTLAHSLGRWWSENRRQGTNQTAGSFTAIDGDSTVFARAAASEAKELAVLLGADDLSDSDALAVAQLEADTPPLSMDDGCWFQSLLVAKLEQVTISSLATYRCIGLKNAEGSLGRDDYGRVWRRQGIARSPIWYLKRTLKSKRGS